MTEHSSKGGKCAKYTLNHSALKLEAAWESENRSLASKLEYHIKTLSKAQKEELIKNKRLQDFLAEKIEVNAYKIVSKFGAQ